MSVAIMSPEDIEALCKRVIENYAAAVPVTEREKVEILTQDQLSERLQVSVQTLIRLRKKNKLPFIELGDCIRYNLPDVLKSLSKIKK